MREALVLAVVGLAGCDAITPVPASPAPVNACLVAGDCAGFPVDGGAVQCATIGGGTGACQVASTGSYVLVVTVPSLAPTLAAGSTYALTSDALFTTKPEGDPNVCVFANGAPVFEPCFKLPPLVVASGAYVIFSSQAAAAGRPVSSVGFDGGVTLPVGTTFWPSWLAPGAPAPTDVRFLNLPLPPVQALVGPEVAQLKFTLDFPASAPNGGDAGVIEWIAGLAPLPESVPYDGVVQVAPPFDDAYPDSVYQVVTTGGPQSPVSVLPTGPTLPTLIEEPAQGITVTRGPSEALGDGWTVHLRDHSTHEAVSSLATLAAGQTVARTNVVSNVGSITPDVVVDPPSGVAFPELVVPESPLPSGVPAPRFPLVVYPVLPPLVHVSGIVRAPDHTAVSSTLLFYSTQIQACPPTALDLFYATRVQTADQLALGGKVGEFSVDLPQGEYAVVVDPSPQSGYAKNNLASAKVLVDETRCSGPPRSLADLVLEPLTPIVLSGTVVTADGRPVANAEVDFAPSAALAPSLDPANPVNASNVFRSVVAQDSWPRSARTTTGATGAFRMSVDPFSQYDLTVRPQDGTAFPWTVRPFHTVYDANVALAPIVVPAPFVVQLTLHDPSENPLVSAVVQAYTFTTFATPAASYSVALPIGQALTDANGQLTMVLTTSLAP